MFTQLRQFIHYETNTYTYLLWSENQAVIIDPVDEDVPRYIAVINDLNLELVYALDTHVHADHITALGLLREKTGCKTVFGEQSNNTCADKLVKDGDIISFGTSSIECLYTPGHTNDSYSYYWKRAEQSSNDCVFTGDTLLIRGCGRTDFQNGDTESLYESISNKLMTLPSNTIVFPAHDYNGRTFSSIAEESDNNPRINLDKEAFIDFMSNLNLPDPKFMDVAVPANLACGNKS